MIFSWLSLMFVGIMIAGAIYALSKANGYQKNTIRDDFWLLCIALIVTFAYPLMGSYGQVFDVVVQLAIAVKILWDFHDAGILRKARPTTITRYARPGPDTRPYLLDKNDYDRSYHSS